MNKQKGMLKLGKKNRDALKNRRRSILVSVEPVCRNLLVYNRNAKRFTVIQNSRLMAKVE